jgi:hypothetical protein
VQGCWVLAAAAGANDNPPVTSVTNMAL